MTSTLHQDPTYNEYLSSGFIPLLCKGYHPKYNQCRIYDTAKQPAFDGWNSPEYIPPSLEKIEQWEREGGWTGWKIPEGVIALDVEDPEDISFLLDICRKEGVEPSKHRTNNGFHFLFHTDRELSASSKVFVRVGLEVTYRIGGKNQLILAPTNGRSWEVWKPQNELPKLPEKLLPYDRKNPGHVLNCLSRQVGKAYRNSSLSGYEDLDFGFMGLLISCKVSLHEIEWAFAIIFGSDYDGRRTTLLYEKTRQKMENGEPAIGAGTFLQRVKERGLTMVERFARELQTATGAGMGQVIEEWPEPVTLPEGLPPVQSLEPEMIPEPFRGWIMDISDRMQCPPDFTAAAAIVVAGAIIGRACGIYPKRRDDWLEYPNLWGAVIGRPSLLKSPAIAEALKPLRRLAADADKIYQEELLEYEKEKMIAKAKKDALEKSIKDAIKKGEDPMSLFDGSEELIPPVHRRFMTQDGTTEKIGEILVNNPRGLLNCRDELIGWLKNMNKPGREGDRAFYLESWNAKGSFTVDRIGRGTINIPALCLSIFGAVTPGPLSEYVRAAVQDGIGNDGLLQRIQVAVYPDAPATWKNVDRFPDTEQKNRAFEIFKILADEEFYQNIPGDPPGLRFDDEAQDIFNGWRGELEARLRTGDLSPALESHLAKYRKLIPCLALIFHLIEVADGKTCGPVSEQAIIQAAAWGEYLESHANPDI